MADVIHNLDGVQKLQILYGALHKEGAAAGAGEDAELTFAHMSGASHTTRNMSEAGKHQTCFSQCTGNLITGPNTYGHASDSQFTPERNK